MLKLRSNYLLVFAVTHKKKYKGFYTPQKSSYADYFETMAVWVAGMGPNCQCIRDGIGLGAKCIVRDIYELGVDPLSFSVMQEYGSKVDFGDDILEEAKEHDGIVEAFVIHENSLIAMEESTWRKNPRLSWEEPSLEKPLLVPKSSTSEPLLSV